jgi:hypothetical protein
MSCTKNDELGPVTDTIENSLQDEESDEKCPLFMDGLPKDFSSNPQLAALASLINDDDEGNDISNGAVAVTGKKGGGKVDRKSQRRAQRQDAPYLKPTKNVPAASLGEAQLFLKMWSLK